ncbi:MAG: cell division protein ZapE [Acidimicrobiia bacterium]|nr:cell division protein ZapE [Acidimicrobiia bacterium]
MRAESRPLRLVDRVPDLEVDELVARLEPPRRFADVRFETYVPSPEHPSQASALAAMQRFAADLIERERPAGRRFTWRRSDVESDGAPARYLDGGYGVGKTHLLAALWHAAPQPKAYFTFAELTALIGFVGMASAVGALQGQRLLCIDEFELDDVANTLMTVTFLRSIIPAVRVATTSNALPDRLGEGRFSADDFRREIAAIAAHFEVVTIDGPDYRRKARVVADALDESTLERLVTTMPGPTAVDDFDALLVHLRRVHPVRFKALVDGLDAVVVRGLHPIANQGDALLFCALVDELYDAEVRLAVSGCGVSELFPESYRHGGYRKKYGRCESRLAAMLAELDSAP